MDTALTFHIVVLAMEIIPSPKLTAIQQAEYKVARAEAMVFKTAFAFDTARNEADRPALAAAALKAVKDLDDAEVELFAVRSGF